MPNQFGQFAGSFADAFAETASLINEKKRLKQIADLQAKLVKAQLEAGQIKVDAQTKLGDIMTGTRTQFQLGDLDEEGIGTFRPTGARVDDPTREPVTSVAGILSDPEGFLAAMQSGALDFGDVLDFQSEQNRLDAIPDLNTMLAGQVDDKGNPPFILGSVTLDPLRGPVQSIIRNPEYSTRQQEELSGLTLRELTDSALEAIDIESTLAGSTVESGFPFGEQARTVKSAAATVGGLLGFDTKKQEESVFKRDRLDKLYGLVLNTRLNRLMEKDGNLTVTQIQQQMEISPSTDKRAEANALLLADFLQEEINRMDIEGTPISKEERNKVFDFIRKARTGEFFNADQAPVVDVPEIAKMTRAELEQLDIEGMSDEMFDAVKKRLAELE